ncbi:hypothetical protein [Olleya namhaensis]|uniref:Uncharacterized protein n=1 Tax=Olleya namhaensis TaxID=1144750 RepID=A0A1I3T8U4_9FLAO|nr:hypothetical protein [Olleya namhaensis]SFJ67598.1 hypothetical protein SAMN05443431_1181 [Olleya namhaensis]
MNEDENWIEELTSSIIEESDKILFEETAGCFLTDNLRASYIMSWISIIESLKRKIKLFSNLGDSRATSAYEKIEDYEDKKKSTDRLIFEESKNCGIIDNTDLSTINYLWEQRCLFAHPYNKKPEKDEVKHIIRQSIKLVLGKELLYNKDYLTELAENITNKPFFLPTETDRIRNFAKTTIARTPKELHPFLFKTLLFKISQVSKNEDKTSELKKLHYYLVELFISTPLSIEDASWSLENRVTKFPYECFIGFVHTETWEKFPLRIQEMLISYLDNEKDETRLNKLKSITVKLIEDNKLESVLKLKYFEKLDNTYFDSAINSYGETNAMFSRVKSELESWQYEQQGPVADYLKEEIGRNFVNSLNPDNQFYLGRLIKACASSGSWKTQYLLSSISNNSDSYPNNILAGIAYTSFVAFNDSFRLDNDSLLKAIKLLDKIKIDIQNSTYEKIKTVVNEYNPDEFDKMVYSEQSIISLTTKINELNKEWNGNHNESFNSTMALIQENFA